MTEPVTEPVTQPATEPVTESSARYAVDGVVFDMDGVIIDSRPVIENAWREVARRHEVALDPATFEHYVHGRTGAETVRALFPDHSHDQRMALWKEVDQIEEEAAYEAIDGVCAFVRALDGLGVRLALATSSWPRKIDNALGGLGLADAFAVRITRDDVSRGKPHPEPYLAAADALGIPAPRLLVFEDSTSGVRSATAAGAITVGIGAANLTEVGAATTVADFTPLKAVHEPTGTVRLEGTSAEIGIALLGERTDA
ncbi:HAD family phosphatase [Streptomyces sp. NBC_00237]|uniref:HAD family hydrolase n=1 Tax=Streptomyces sp. NBC_00237 TaxID=2975687 RepID=UPI002250B9CD|nr:HAD family phosphatase [Streptomyces sp. NBC_00237]MCX5200693.1 HAD family phosphatase [Streptomyces sp. NBC_00237]